MIITREKKTIILFPSCPIEGIRHVDYDYKVESIYAIKYFNIANIDIDSIKTATSSNIETFNIPIFEKPTLAIYRGWMLSEKRYSILFDYLREKHNISLINTPEEYSTLHYFPNIYESIKKYTPKTIFSPIEDIDNLLISSKEKFDNHPVLIKDYVKSESAYLEASFISNGGNSIAMKDTISKLRDLRGSEFNIGIVIKEQINIARNENTNLELLL